jgi:hypothetical protein
VSAVAEPQIERWFAHMKRARRRVALRRLIPNGPATQFTRHPDRVAGATDWPADDPITPGARLLIRGEPFEIDGDIYFVEDVHPSTVGPQADILVLRGYEYMRGEDRSTRRAVQVRDLETLIDDDRVFMPFIGGARQFNLSRGWCRGGRTLKALGIELGSADDLDSSTEGRMSKHRRSQQGECAQ